MGRQKYFPGLSFLFFMLLFKYVIKALSCPHSAEIFKCCVTAGPEPLSILNFKNLTALQNAS